MAGQPAGTYSPESENETTFGPCPRNEAPPRHECPSRRRNCCQARGTLHRDRQRGQTASRSNFVIVQADAPHRPNGRGHTTIPIENRFRPGRRRLPAPGQIDDLGRRATDRCSYRPRAPVRPRHQPIQDRLPDDVSRTGPWRPSEGSGTGTGTPRPPFGPLRLGFCNAIGVCGCRVACTCSDNGFTDRIVAPSIGTTHRRGVNNPHRTLTE